MLCEINEAFIHNSCKKTAQLVKVITSMLNQKLDFNHERIVLFNQQDAIIEEISQNYIEKMTNKYEKLVIYRKGVINDACVEYGQLYKAIKLCFSDEIQESLATLNNIRNDAKSAKDEMQKTMEIIKKQSENYRNLTNSFLKSIENKSVDCENAIRRSRKEHLSAYKEKEKSFNSKAKKEILEITEENMEIINALKKEIKGIFANEINKRMDVIKNLDARVISLRTFNTGTKEMFSSIQNQKKKLFNASIQKRQTLVSQTVKEYKPLRKRIAETKKAIQVEKQIFEENMQKTTKEICSRKQKQNAALAKIQLEINKYGQAEESAKAAFENKMNKINSEDEENRTSLKSAFKMEESEFKSSNNEVKKMHKDKLHKKRIIFRKIHSKNGDMVTSLESWKENFIEELKDDENSSKASYEAEESGLSTVLKTKIEQYNCFKQVEDSSSKGARENVEKENRNIHDANNAERKKLEEERNVVKEQNNKRLKEAEKKYEIIGSERKAKRENEVSKKKEEHKISFSNVIKTFSNDLEEKKKAINENNQSRIIYEEDVNVIELEKKKHEDQMKKLKSELNILTNQCTIAKSECEKRVADLNDQYFNLDKVKRQRERASHQAQQDIINEFETSIQILQVQLNDKINNIAGLYTEEENKRGSEIIELKRKIAQTRNRTDDLIKREEKKLTEAKSNYKLEAEKVNAEIDRLRTNSYQDEIMKTLREKEKCEKEKIEAYEKETEEILDEIKRKIEKTKSDIETEKQRILKEKEENENEVIDECPEIEIDTSKIEESFEQKKAEIENNFSHERLKVESRKNDVIESINEIKRSLQKEIDNTTAKLEEEYEILWMPFQTEINKIKEGISKENDELDKRTVELEDQQIDMIINAFDPKKRQQEEGIIREKKGKAALRSDEIKELFNDLFDVINGNKVKKVVEPPAYTRQNSSRRVKRKQQE